MAKQVEIIAGGLADELFRSGLPNDRNMLSATALVHPQHHNLVVQAHERYLDAGATLLLTSNTCVVPGLGFTIEEIREYTRLAGRLAIEARDRAGTRRAVQICGSLPPLMPSYRSDRTIDRQHGLDTYQLIGEALWPFVDMFVAEPMSSVAEAKLALGAVAGLKKPVMVAFALNSTGELRSGESINESILELLAFCDERISAEPSRTDNTDSTDTSTDNTGNIDTSTDSTGNTDTNEDDTENSYDNTTTTTTTSSSSNDNSPAADSLENSSRCTSLRAILFSCSQAEDVAKALHHVSGAKELARELADRGIQLGGYADRISPHSKAGVLEEKLVSGAMHSAVDMEIFASFALRWVEDGATIVGGCCGVPPDYLARIRDRVGEQQVSP